ncbi:hypothetical protein [Legionella sp. km772]|uniref:hypothetical protein n=1 Tax=Legionella sp. km772 TaxID=2498111 RepID=UPI001F4227C3|nr:hypothetical protein [Legionella sp. km772]
MMTECISILQAIMDALRVALRDRAILTNAYHYELPAKEFEIRKRNRQAILRIVEIYGSEVKQRHPKIEQLFLNMEN